MSGDIVWLDTDQGIPLVVGGPAGTHVRPASDLERHYQDRVRELEEALVRCWQMGQTSGAIRETVEKVIPNANERVV
jgi:NAD(P)H-nitrite reductase large subunit